MRRIIIPAAAGLALMASAGTAAAQEHERQGRTGPAPGGGGIHVPAPAGGNRAINQPRQSAPERQAPRVEAHRRAAEPSHQAEFQHPNRQHATEHAQQRGAERERQRHTEHERNAEKARSAERERAADQKRAEERQRRTVAQPSEREKQAAAHDGRGDHTAEQIREARTHLTADQHRRLLGAFDLQRARVAKARFDWHVGHRVPRDVRLFRVPAEVISFFPYYRDYSYFVVGDDICIVDPRTYEVVDVIDQTYPITPHRQVARLMLSGSQIALVRDSIPPDLPVAGVRLRMALGAEIPGDVELHEFPNLVLDRAPELHNYRFLVTDDQIVIVNPRDRSIALVIDRA